MGALPEVLQTLRALVRVVCERAEVEPRLHVKLLLAEHAEADAASIAALGELGVAAGEPARIDGIEIAYGQVRPALIAALAELEHAVDPLADEALLRALVQARHDQERHLVELPVARNAPAAEVADDPALRAQAQAVLERVAR